MNEMWAVFGGKLAERWVSVLLLPGLLYAGGAYVAQLLGHAHWWQLASVGARLDGLREGAKGQGGGQLLLLTVVVLLASATAGLAAQGLGRAAARVGVEPWGVWPAAPLTARRRRRWDRAHAAYLTALREKARRAARGLDTGGLDTAALGRARDLVCLEEPCSPTWSGDRMAAAGTRVLRAYDLDLESAWPRLWLVVPEPVRAELVEAREKVDAAFRLLGWGVMYLLLGVMWWPALVIGGCTLAVAGRRERNALDAFATLVEAAADVHGRDLALCLGIPCEGAFTRETGAAVTRALQKPPHGG
ncbi:hypothetical protein ACFYWO_28555 [Streptomyces sp. NPDC002932]|uniref:hypothetical protein n=1 Tax=Streptomyces sp. NPDC002932 TaxID=3364672 RepID=UPI003686A992